MRFSRFNLHFKNLFIRATLELDSTFSSGLFLILYLFISYFKSDIVFSFCVLCRCSTVLAGSNRGLVSVTAGFNLGQGFKFTRPSS